MLSMSAFLRDVPLEDAARLLALYGIEIDPEQLDLRSDTMRGRALEAVVDASTRAVRPALVSVLNDLEALSKAGADAVMRPAAGEDLMLLRKLSTSPSDRARALCLYLHEKPDSEDSKAFERAWFLSDCGAHRPNGATWQLFEVTSMSRDWSPKKGTDREINTLACTIAEDFFKEEKEVKCDVYSRPALPDDPDGPKAHCITIEVQGDKGKIEGWKKGNGIRFIPFERGRRFCVVITPHQKTFEFGRDARASVLAKLMAEGIARALFRTSDLEPLEHGTYILSSLKSRRDWPVLHEHGIDLVQVKKLVLTRGAGTVTYHVPAASGADVYDILGKRADQLSSDRILSTTLRVRFLKKGRQRAKTVQFEITRPNKCTLRETHQAEALILNTYLHEWGLRGITSVQEDKKSVDLWPAELNWADIVAGDVPRRRHEWLGVFRDAAEDLIQRHVLVPAGRTSTVPCPNCTIGDLGDYSPLLEEMICNSCGYCEQAQSLWTLYEIDVRAFAMMMAVMLQLDTGPLHEIEVDSLFCLGDSLGEQNRRVLFAPRMLTPQDIDRVAASIRTGAGKSGGLVIGANNLPDSYKWPQKHTYSALREILWVGETQLELKPDFAAEWLDGQKTHKRGGRPTYRSYGEQLAKARRAFGLPLKAGLLLQDLMLWFPDEGDLPTLHTIQNDWKAFLD